MEKKVNDAIKREEDKYNNAKLRYDTKYKELTEFLSTNINKDINDHLLETCDIKTPVFSFSIKYDEKSIYWKKEYMFKFNTIILNSINKFIEKCIELYPDVINLNFTGSGKLHIKEVLTHLAAAHAAKDIADYFSIAYEDENINKIPLLKTYCINKKIDTKDKYRINYDKLKDVYGRYKNQGGSPIATSINDSIKDFKLEQSIYEATNNKIKNYNSVIEKWLDNPNDPILNKIEKWWEDPVAGAAASKTSGFSFFSLAKPAPAAAPAVAENSTTLESINKIDNKLSDENIRKLETAFNEVKNTPTKFTKNVKEAFRDKIEDFVTTFNTNIDSLAASLSKSEAENKRQQKMIWKKNRIIKGQKTEDRLENFITIANNILDAIHYKRPYITGRGPVSGGSRKKTRSSKKSSTKKTRKHRK